MIAAIRFLTVSVAIVSIAAACTAITNAADDEDLRPPLRDSSPLQTDAVAYKLVRSQHAYRATVSASFRNTTSAPIYFQRCMPRDSTPMFFLGRTGPDSTRRFFVDWGWACVGGVPTGVLAPGQTLTIRAPVGSGDQPTMQPPLQPYELVGLFRIRLVLCARFVQDSDYCERVPDPHGRSNAFLVHY